MKTVRKIFHTHDSTSLYCGLFDQDMTAIDFNCYGAETVKYLYQKYLC